MQSVFDSQGAQGSRSLHVLRRSETGPSWKVAPSAAKSAGSMHGSSVPLSVPQIMLGHRDTPQYMPGAHPASSTQSVVVQYASPSPSPAVLQNRGRHSAAEHRSLPSPSVHGEPSGQAQSAGSSGLSHSSPIGHGFIRLGARLTSVQT